jgi:putative endonuclease
MADPRHELGERGEQAAEAYLRAQGMKLVARRFRTPVGELDLVLLDGDTVVFVEVKSQTSQQFNEPHERVDGAKRRKVARTAAWFLHHRRLAMRPCRFDVVSILIDETGAPQIRHFPDAFAPGHDRGAR